MSGSRRLLLLGDSAVGKTSLLHRVMDDTFTPNFISTVRLSSLHAHAHAHTRKCTTTIWRSLDSSTSLFLCTCVRSRPITRLHPLLPPLRTLLHQVGIDFRDRTMQVRGEAVRLRIWDTAGQERFRTITSQFYRGSQGILLCYDLTNMESFNNVNHWLQQIRKNADVNIQIVLVGNKKDRAAERKVSTEEGRAMATKFELKHFFETSAKSGDGVEVAFQSLAELVVAQFRIDGAPNVTTSTVTLPGSDETEVEKKCAC